MGKCHTEFSSGAPGGSVAGLRLALPRLFLSDPCRGSWPSTLLMSLPRLIFSDPCRASWPSTLRMSLPRHIFSDPSRGSWLPVFHWYLINIFRGSFSATPNEDRGFRYLISIVISSIFHRHLISIGISSVSL